MEHKNYLGWIYPKTENIASVEDVSNIIQLQKGNSNGLATLDGAGKVPTNQLPSYVDDVLEFETKQNFPSRGEEGKIYVDADSNYTYRWTGNTYILIGGLQNLVDGTVTGSIRSVTAIPESEIYHLGNNAIALGTRTKSSGIASNAEGFYTEASGNGSHVEGYAIQDNVGGYGEIKASGIGSHAQGYSNAYQGSNSAIIASGKGAHAQGYAYDANTIASGDGSHAEGYVTKATGNYSHAEGTNTTASGQNAHAEGNYTTASGNTSHAEGNNTQATESYTHAEGERTTASGVNSHAEGYYTQATNTSAHAEGNNTIASGASSHAEGNQTTASGLYSHASGIGTTAQHQSQTVIGEYNVLDTQGTLSTRGKYVFIVGNGTGTNNRSNALAVTWDGNVQAAGTPNAANHLATKSYVDTNIIDLESQIQTLGASISSPIVCFTYDITNGQTPSIDFSYTDIESAMEQNKIVFIVYKQVITEGSFTAQHISQTRVTECNMYVTEGTPSYRIYTEDSQMQFIASSDSQFMTRASSSQIDPDPSDRDPGDFA